MRLFPAVITRWSSWCNRASSFCIRSFLSPTRGQCWHFVPFWQNPEWCVDKWFCRCSTTPRRYLTIRSLAWRSFIKSLVFLRANFWHWSALLSITFRAVHTFGFPSISLIMYFLPPLLCVHRSTWKKMNRDWSTFMRAKLTFVTPRQKELTIKQLYQGDKRKRQHVPRATCHTTDPSFHAEPRVLPHVDLLPNYVLYQRFS